MLEQKSDSSRLNETRPGYALSIESFVSRASSSGGYIAKLHLSGACSNILTFQANKTGYCLISYILNWLSSLVSCS